MDDGVFDQVTNVACLPGSSVRLLHARTAIGVTDFHRGVAAMDPKRRQSRRGASGSTSF